MVVLVFSLTSLQSTYVSDPWFVYYKTLKHAVMGFTKTLGHSNNYEKTGVRVFAVCPGFTDTKLLEKKNYL